MDIKTVYDLIFYVGAMIMIASLDVFMIVATYYYIKEKKIEEKKDNLEVTSFKR